MSSPTVRAHHDELGSIRGTFSAQSDTLTQMNQNLKACMETLQGGDWIGKGAQAFYREMSGDVLPSLHRMQRAMSEAARITQQMSQAMKEAEDEASGCFKIA
jgi:WXG100 family type VII secretion target